MSAPLFLYQKLLSEFGPQHWWPADSQYEVVVGALLTQNTNWKNVEKAISNLKMANKLDPHSLLETGDRELETLIRPSGFYRQKAERLKLLTKKYIEIIESGTDPPTRVELLELKGIGRETADSILLYAFDYPIFVIDAYTKRFCTHHRLFVRSEPSKIDYDEYRNYFESNLPKDVRLYKEYHALIVEWAKKTRKI